MEKEVDDTHVLGGFFRFFSILVYFAVIMLLAFVSDEAIGNVFLGLFPSLIILILYFVFDYNLPDHHRIVLGMPAVVVLASALVTSSGMITLFDADQIPSLIFLNVVIGYFLLVFFMRKKVRKLSRREIAPIKKIFKKCEIKVSRDKKELEKLRLKLLDYERDLYDTKQDARVSKDQLEGMQNSLAQYSQKVADDAVELENVRNELKRYATALYETRKDAVGVEQELQPLRDLIAGYHKKAEQDSAQLDYLRKTVDEYSQELNITKKEMVGRLRSIEDKCKAINFVIGRVYSNKKGGSKELRGELKIPRELYNDFSDILSKPKSTDKYYLLKILKAVHKRLENLEKLESKIGAGRGKLYVQRKFNDTVLDFLERNDNDPIKDYHAEAKLICTKLISLVEDDNLEAYDY